MARSLREDSAALTLGDAGASSCRMPARLGLLQATQHAATAAEGAEHTLKEHRRRGAGATCCWCRCCWRSEHRVRAGAPPDREPRGGSRAVTARCTCAARRCSAEIDELAEILQHHGRPHRALRGRNTAAQPGGGSTRHVAERTAQLHHLAHHDPLTGLPNRRKLSAHPGERAGAPRNQAAPGAAVRGCRQFQVDQRHPGSTFRRPGAAEHVRRAPARRHRGHGPAGASGEANEFTVLLEDVQSSEEVESRAAQDRPQRCRSRSSSTAGACSPPAPASARACTRPITRRTHRRAAARRGRGAVPRQGSCGRNRFALYGPALYEAAAQAFSTRAVAAPRGRGRRPAAHVPASPGGAA